MIDASTAARQLLMLREVESSFLGFVRGLYPNFKFAPFHLKLIDVLDRLEKGTLVHPDTGKPVRRVLINMPPRHGKTFLATTLFPVYYMARKPHRKVMSVSYNGELAKTFGRSVREHAKEPLVRQAFPNFKMAEDSQAADLWRTTENGAYFGVGVGGTTTGRAANLLITDDPIKARAEAESLTYRNNIWSYYISALITRKEPEIDGTPPIEIMIHTRWHPDDPAGRIQELEEWAEGEWLHINMPSISTVETDERIPRDTLPESDPQYLPTEELETLPLPDRYIYKTEEVALWPERFPVKELRKFEAKDPREFASLFQQTPFIQGGNIIKSSWWRTAETIPDNFMTVIMAADTAYKKSERSDYSVISTLGMTYEGDIYILDIVRGKYDFPELKRLIPIIASRWRGRGLRGMYIEDKASGQSLIQELRRDSGVPVIPYSSMADKVARANAILPIIEGGRVFLPKEAPWKDAFLAECNQFPNGSNDDQVDSVVIGLDTLSRMPVASSAMLSAPIDLRDSLFNQAALSASFASTPLFSTKREPFLGWGE
jgi:predicted phage terminase large subunit-like protein